MAPLKGKQKTDFIIAAVMSLTVLVVLILYAGYLRQLPKAGTGEFRIPVFGTSDIHGGLTGEMEEPHKYMLAFIADKVEDARQTDSGLDTDRTVLIDGGDIYQGNAVSDVVKGESLSAAFDAMEYDAVAVGNHEFDWGLETVIDNDSTMRDYNDGYARSIRPVHTTADGDSIYAVSAGNVEADQDLVGSLSAVVMSEAIKRAVYSADSAYGFKSAKDLNN